MPQTIVEFRWQRSTAERWLLLDPILEKGEPGLEQDTGKFKIGDGMHPWSLLPYYLNEIGVAALIQEMIAELGGGGGFDPRVGNLNDLSTDVKSSLVAAINEVNTPSVSLRSLYNNAKAG